MGKGGKCGCESSSNSGSSATMANQLADITTTIETIKENIKAFTCGKPILLIVDADDIATFSIATGAGSGCWDKWALCDGKTHYDPKTKKNVTTPNFIDKFVIMALGDLEPGDTGGEKEVTLTTPQLPVHNHTVSDPGHSHDIQDPGHTHGVADPGHSHTGSSSPHTHTFDTSIIGGHEHSTGTIGISDDDGGDVAVRLSNADPGSSTSTAGEHSHSGTTDSTAAGITTESANTGISTQSAFVGIEETEDETTGISVAVTGEGLPHNNMPPYFAAIYVIKIKS